MRELQRQVLPEPREAPPPPPTASYFSGYVDAVEYAILLNPGRAGGGTWSLPSVVVSTLCVQLMLRNGSPSPGGGSGRGGGGGASDYFVDPKLLYRVKQFVGNAHERGSVPTEDAAMDHLLDKFKEYVRKPQVCVQWSRLFLSCERFVYVIYCIEKFIETGPLKTCGMASSSLVQPYRIAEPGWHLSVPYPLDKFRRRLSQKGERLETP